MCACGEEAAGGQTVRPAGRRAGTRAGGQEGSNRMGWVEQDGRTGWFEQIRDEHQEQNIGVNILF